MPNNSDNDFTDCVGVRRLTPTYRAKRGPKPNLIEFAGVGHAPALMADDQIAVVCDFLLSN